MVICLPQNLCIIVKFYLSNSLCNKVRYITRSEKMVQEISHCESGQYIIQSMMITINKTYLLSLAHTCDLNVGLIIKFLDEVLSLPHCVFILAQFVTSSISHYIQLTGPNVVREQIVSTTTTKQGISINYICTWNFQFTTRPYQTSLSWR